ncbi:MAG: sigma-54 dependent transcriptional regulator [Planctomycetota bacterium]
MGSRNRRILVVDDEKMVRWSLRQRLEEEGYDVEEAPDAATAVDLLQKDDFDLLLLDYRLPDSNGLEILKKAKGLKPDQLAILMTAFSSVKNAVEAIRLGAYDYLDKPFDLDELMLTVEKALETVSLRSEVSRMREKEREQFGVENLIGHSKTTEELRRMVKRIAKSGASSILITGESGTGKGLVARAIHYESDSAIRPFMNITCTALPETLLESELFGHERGAFTDARNAKKGLLELADTGTAFLDEIGDMPLKLQAKLLRFLEDKSFRRLGGTKDIQVNVRIVAASNKDLKAEVDAGTFRADLFYRLNVIPLEVPPLRVRSEDIPDLVDHFVRYYNNEFKKSVAGFSEAGLERLKTHTWPGNIRELRNVVERAILLSDEKILTLADLPPEIRGTDQAVDRTRGKRYFALPPSGIDIDDVERDLLEQALLLAAGNKTRAGRLLNLRRDQVRYWMRKYSIPDRDMSVVEEETPA